MAYSKTNWQNGITPINENNLNKVEQGIFDLGQTVNVSTAGTDLDDYIENGVYFFNNANTPTNKPSGVTVESGYLEVIARNTNDILQRWTECNRNTVWQRQKGGETWNNWFKLGEEKNILTANLTDDYTINTANTLLELPINKLYVKVGTKLSLSNNGIKIGTGVNHIKISGQVYWRNADGQSGSINILKNNISSRFVDSNAVFTRTKLHQNIFSGIVEVETNDIIKLGVNISATGVTVLKDATGTFLTVEVVD